MKKKRTVYVVIAREGDYEVTEWPVVAFEGKVAAEAEIARREAICGKWKAKINALGEMPWPHDTPESDAWWTKRDRLRKRAAKITGGSEHRDPDDVSYRLFAVPLLPAPPSKEG